MLNNLFVWGICPAVFKWSCYMLPVLKLAAMPYSHNSVSGAL